MVIPHTAAGIALLMVFGSRGVLGKFLAPLGWLFTDTVSGIVVAMLFVGLPFLVNASREAFALVDVELEQAAYVEGASPWGAFYHVTLPIARRGVIAGLVMMWSRGISEYGAVVILAYHPKIAPVLIYERFRRLWSFRRPAGSRTADHHRLCGVWLAASGDGHTWRWAGVSPDRVWSMI